MKTDHLKCEQGLNLVRDAVWFEKHMWLSNLINNQPHVWCILHLHIWMYYAQYMYNTYTLCFAGTLLAYWTFSGPNCSIYRSGDVEEVKRGRKGPPYSHMQVCTCVGQNRPHQIRGMIYSDIRGIRSLLGYSYLKWMSKYVTGWLMFLDVKMTSYFVWWGIDVLRCFLIGIPQRHTSLLHGPVKAFKIKGDKIWRDKKYYINWNWEQYSP